MNNKEMSPVQRLRSWMEEMHYDGVLLGRRDNYTWITGGSQNHVCTNTEAGIAHYLILKDKIYLFADSSDKPRMSQEQNPLEGEAVLIPWYGSADECILEKIAEYKQSAGSRENQKTEDSRKSAGAGTNEASCLKIVSDDGIAGAACVQDQLVDLRMKLSEDEIDRYRQIGALCASIVEGVAGDARPGMTELEVAAELKIRCLRAGVSPDCVLVGSDERILNYRHPMPTDKKIEKSLMVVLGGEKYGLNISMTRFVYFDDVPEIISDRMKKTAEIFVRMQLLMKEGLSYGEYFEKVKALYAAAGYPDEWKMHHQGGPTGYACREFVMTPDNHRQIHTGQAYAWNPTIQGTKCEETTLLTENGIEIFTRTKDWPVIEVQTEYGSLTAAGILRK